MKTILFILFSCLLMAECNHVHAQDTYSTDSEEFKYSLLEDKASEYIKNEMYHLAIDVTKQMEKMDCANSNKRNEYYSFAYCYFKIETYDKCIDYCNKFIASSHEDKFYLPMIYKLKGTAHLLSKDFDNAVTSLEYAISYTDSSDYQELMNLHAMIADCYFYKKQDHLSKIFYKKAIFFGCKEGSTSIKKNRKRRLRQSISWIYFLFI